MKNMFPTNGGLTLDVTIHKITSYNILHVQDFSELQVPQYDVMPSSAIVSIYSSALVSDSDKTYCRLYTLIVIHARKHLMYSSNA